MPTPEEIQRRREIIERRRAAAARPAGPSFMERLGPAAPPLRALGRGAIGWLEYPKHGVTEGIQRYGELKEIRDEAGGGLGGYLAAQKHGLQEFASDALDFSSLLTGGRIPKELGDQLDPSKDTDLGREFEALKQEFRNREGRDPSLMEQYDMKTEIQDIAMPGLTERHKLGPLDFSTRGALEFTGEAAAVAGEILVSGGALTAGRQIAKQALKAGLKVEKSQMLKGAARAKAGEIAGKSITAAGKVVQQPFSVPHYFDKLSGAIFGTALRGAWATTKFGVKLPIKATGLPIIAGIKTYGGVKMLVNHFRRNALDKGADMATTNAAAVKEVEKLVKANGVEIKPDSQLSFNDWYETGIDNVKVRQNRETPYKGTRDLNAGERLANSFLDPVDTPTGKKIAAGDDDFGFVRNARTFIATEKDLAVGGTTQYRTNLRKVFQNTKLSKWMKPGVGINRLETGTRKVISTAMHIGKALAESRDVWMNRKEQMLVQSRTRFAYLMREIEINTSQLDNKNNPIPGTGMFRWNVGGYQGRAPSQMAADLIDNNPNTILASGNSVGNLLENASHKYYDIGDVATKGNLSVVIPEHISDASLRGYTRITPSIETKVVREGNKLVRKSERTNIPRYYLNKERTGPAGKVEWQQRVDAKGNKIFTEDPLTTKQVADMDLVAVNLDPAFSDVLQQVGLYRPMLRTVKQVVQNVDEAGNKIPDSWMNAEEVFDELAAVAREYEQALQAIGAPIAFTSRAVHAGGQYIPTNPLQGGVANSWLPEGQIQLPEFAIKTDKGRIIPQTHQQAKVYASQSEGQWAGQWYMHPQVAIADYGEYVAEAIIADKTGKFVQQVARQFDIDNATVKNLLGSDREKEITGYIMRMQQALEDVMSRQKKTGVKINKVLVRDAKKLFDEITQAEHVDDVFEDAAAGGNLTEAAANRINAMMPRLADWDKRFTALAGELKATAREKARLQKALKQAKDAYSDYKKIVDKDLKSIAGVGLEKMAFPKVFSDALLKSNVVRSSEEMGNLILKANSMLRVMGATGDFSAMGIQGHVGIMNDIMETSGVTGAWDKVHGMYRPKVLRKRPAFMAMSGSFKALMHSGDDIVGEYFWRAEQIARKTGNLTPSDMANEGLAILNNAPDLYFGARGGIRDLPGIRNVDAAFTHFGNIFRYEMATNEVYIAMLKHGKTAQELMDDGTVKAISEIANLMSGVGRRGYGGQFSQFILFAPRFFHARLKMMQYMAMGYGPYGGKKIQKQLARKYMNRMFGQATYLTFVINEFLGEETDIVPYLRSKDTGEWFFNPNFLRIHAGPIDISLLGPYDSMLRIMSIGPLMALNIKEGLGMKWDKLRMVLSAPATSGLVDLFTGENAIGETTRWEEGSGIGDKIQWLGDFMLDHMTPFAWGETLFGDPGRPSTFERGWDSIKRIPSEPLKGLGGTAAAIGQTGLQVVGVKSSYESISEMRNEAFADIIENMEIDQKRLIMGESVEGMTDEQVENQWMKTGHSWLHDLSNIFNAGGQDFEYKVSFRGGLNDPLPKWENIAKDHQGVIKKMASENLFPEHMTKEEFFNVEERIKQRMEKSASEYAQLQLEYDKINESVTNTLNGVEEAFLAMQETKGPGQITYGIGTFVDGKAVKDEVTEDISPGDLRRYMEIVREIRAHGAQKRHALTFKGIVDKETLEVSGKGKYAGVIEALFPETGMRKYSNQDFDIYAAGSDMYFKDFYNPTIAADGTPIGPIVSPADGAIDWDLKDKKVAEWTRKMKELFPHLTDKRLRLYLHRVEDSMAKDSPPLAQELMLAQKRISRAVLMEDEKGVGKTFYELDDLAIDRVAEFDDNKGVDKEKIIAFYKEWKSSESRKATERRAAREGVHHLDQITKRRDLMIDDYFSMRGGQYLGGTAAEKAVEKERRAFTEALLVLLDKRYAEGKRTPTSPRARFVRNMLLNQKDQKPHPHRAGPWIKNMAKFVRDVNDPVVTTEDLVRTYWPEGIPYTEGMVLSYPTSSRRP